MKVLEDDNKELKKRIVKLEKVNQIKPKDHNVQIVNSQEVDKIVHSNYKDYQDDISNVNIDITNVEVKNVKKHIGERENLNVLYSEVARVKIKEVEKKNEDFKALSNNVNSVNNIDSATQYFEEKRKLCEISQLSQTMIINNPAYYADMVKNHKANDQHKTAAVKIVSEYLNSMNIDKDLMKDIIIDKVTHEKKKINNTIKDTLKIDYKTFNSIIIVKNHLKYLPKLSQFKVNDYIPYQYRDNYNVYKDLGDKHWRNGYEYRIWLKNNGFQLRVKKKGDKTSWPLIPPYIPPIDMPLAYLGKMSDSVKSEIINIENQNINNLISKRDLRIADFDNRSKEREIIRLEKEKDLNNKRPRSEEEASETNKKKVDQVIQLEDKEQFPMLVDSEKTPTIKAHTE